jgi:hypothetical protein
MTRFALSFWWCKQMDKRKKSGFICLGTESLIHFTRFVESNEVVQEKPSWTPDLAEDEK